MKTIFISLIGVLCLVPSFHVEAFPQPKDNVIFEEKFDAFIRMHADIFKENQRGRMYNVDTLRYNISQTSYTAVGETRDVTVRDIPTFDVIISSNLSAAELNFAFTFQPITVKGNYTLSGSINDFIFLSGQGNFSQRIEGVHWEMGATLEINDQGYAHIPATLTAVGYYPVVSKFQGMDSEGIYEEVIREYLQSVGTSIFYEIEFEVVLQFIDELFVHLNSALQTTPVDEILGPYLSLKKNLHPDSSFGAF